MTLRVSMLPHPGMRWRVTLVAIYLGILLPILMSFNVGLTPDSLVFVFLGAAVIIGRPLVFLRDWGVFFLFVILWQQTGPVATWAGFPLHVNELIAADRWLAWPLLHGQLPQVWLQRHLFHGHWAIVQYAHDRPRLALRAVRWQWYDVLSWAVYGLHFPEPLIVGFAIWLRSRANFQRYAVAYLVLAALAFIGYIIYPAAPPWMAAHPYFAGRYHYHPIPLVGNIFDAFNHYVLQGEHGQHYKYVLHVSYNLTAAMPSLHAAFPVLSALYLRKTFGNRGLLMLGYALVVWFAVVYMAEHWIVDVLAGLGCTIIAYTLVEGGAWVWQRTRSRRSATAREAGVAAISAFGQRAGEGQ